MKVAVVGVTGLVGTRMIEILEERNFPVSEFIPVASEKSIGKKIKFKNNMLSKEQKMLSRFALIWLSSLQEQVLQKTLHLNLQR